VNDVLKRIESVFAAAAREKGLRLRMVPCSAWVRSDVILLERISLNLVSNAIRYTQTGGVVLGCRRAGSHLKIEVCDSGIGIPEGQRRSIFGEFYQIPILNPTGREGLGLGLAIVDRLCNLLKHSVDITSTVGKGSRFTVTVPLAPKRVSFQKTVPTVMSQFDSLVGKLIVVIDDDALVLDSTGGLLRSWGCRVITAQSDQEVVEQLDSRPDVIISDYRLKNGRNGMDAIAQLRDAFGADIPAFLISGDILPQRLEDAQTRGYQLLHKPLAPMALRAVMSRLLQSSP
jgi:CheY-like chemotaxis protein